MACGHGFTTSGPGSTRCVPTRTPGRSTWPTPSIGSSESEFVIVSFGGPEAVRDFHAALQSVVLNAGGWPLAEIDVASKEASG